MTASTTRTGLLSLGCAAAVGQAALLREAMAALGGSELAWGAVLALWLAGTGAGSWLGSGRHTRAATALPGVALVLAFAGVVLLRAAPRLTGAVTGEAGSTVRQVWLWGLAVLPPAAAGGLAFAALAARLAGKDGAGGAYALEASGAFAGGAMFTFALAGTGSAAALATTLGVVVSLQLGSARRWLGAVLALVLGVAAAPRVAVWLETSSWRVSGRAGELRDWRETREQRLEIAGDASRVLYADGRLVAAVPDPWRVAPRTHLLMLLHPAPRRVLAVGSLVDGSLETLLRHPVAEVTVVEEDPGLVAMVRAHATGDLAAALADPRVRVLSGDPLRALARGGRGYDLVLLLDGDPATLRRNRTRTREFFAACAETLADDGRVVVRVGVSDTYLGGLGGRLLGSLASTLRQAVAAVAAVPGEEVLLVGGRRAEAVAVEPDTLAARWRAREILDPAFDEAMLPLLVDPGRAPALADFIAAARANANTTDRPRAVLLAAAMSEGRGAPGVVGLALRLVEAPSGRIWLVVGAAAATVLAAGCLGRGLGGVSGVLVGFSSMSWWLLLLVAWQSRLGSVYAEVGLLTGLFMAGTAGGAWIGRRLGTERPAALAMLMALGAALSLTLAGGAPLAHPRGLVVPLLVVAGALTGAAFPAVASLSGGGRPGRGAGRAFGADAAGAAAAALAVGLAGLPWVGMSKLALGLAVIQTAAAGSLAIGSRRIA